MNFFQEDLNNILGEGKRATLKDRENLPYMEATITEIFRVAPTAPGSLPHMTIKDTEICGYRIPKGTQVRKNVETTVIHYTAIIQRLESIKFN